MIYLVIFILVVRSTFGSIDIPESVHRNLAQKKPAYQSTNHETTDTASLAVDGNFETLYSGSDSPLNGPFCSHTELGDQTYDPWWAVNLENIYIIHEVVLTNRYEVSERLRDFTIGVGFEPLPEPGSPVLPRTYTVCSSRTKPVGPGANVTLTCSSGPIIGSIVYVIKHNNTEPLTLCEVQVFGTGITNALCLKECDSGYLYHQHLKTCYRIVNTQTKTWNDARADCQTVAGGDLIQVTSKNVQDFVEISITGSTWLGAKRQTPSDLNSFFWTKNNTPVSDTGGFWGQGEPNNYLGRTEDCLEITELRSILFHMWNDEECNKLRNYICEH